VTRRPDTPAGLDGLATEQVRPGLEDLDSRPSEEVIGLLLAAEAAVPAAMTAARPALATAVDAVADRLAAGGRLLYVGAGTPGRLAALDAAECGPTFGLPPGFVVAVMAGGDSAFANAAEGVEDDDVTGARDLCAHGIAAADVVVGISASGRTPYVLGALAAAGKAGALTVAVVNNAGSPIADAADHAVEVLTGAEIIGGSTRLTAGTAQKVVLNTLSTAVMVRLGKTYGAWMVDVQATNQKLRRRATRVVCDVTGVDEATAAAALAASDGHVKTALVSLLGRVDADVARSLLQAAGGRVRDAVIGTDRHRAVAP
jgi:N-acetylmuramic acid 6-phosphate etherase